MRVPGLRVDLDALERLSPADQEAVRAQLVDVERAFRANPLLGFHPHPKQVEFHSGPFPRTRLFIGGNRSGKTTATMVDTIIQCLDREVVPPHLLPYKRWDPPFYCRAVGPDLTRWLEGVALQKFREWCPKNQLLGNGFQRGWDKQQVVLRFKNESTVQFMSNDQDLDKFTGAALHRVVYDESPREDIWNENRMRLIDYGGEELFGLTPMDGMSNWLYDMFYAPWERGSLDPGLARLVLVDMDDNPHLEDEDKEWALGGKSEEEREARKTGRFITFSGLVYPKFSRSRHVVPALSEVPENASEAFVGIDPGYRHMCAVVFCFLTPDDDLVVFDEIAMRGRTVREVCREIHLRCDGWKIRPRWYVIDPAARNKNTQTGRSDQQEFADHGVPTIPGQNAVGPGINRVRERLDADRLHISADCRELLDEFKKYRWQKESRTENDSRESPVKKDDHLLDALRYVIMQRPLAPEEDRPKPHEPFERRALRASLKRLSRLGGGRSATTDFGPGQWQ